MTTEKLIVIDEIQRVPELLNECQVILQRSKGIRLVLTGSSARSLRQKGVNLLGGRLWQGCFHPLCSAEIGFSNYQEILFSSGLPDIFQSSNLEEKMASYVGVYLKEEIRAEGFDRNIESFARFLNSAGALNGQQINFTQVGSDLGIKPRIIKEYLSILEDTLIGNLVEPLGEGGLRKTVSTAKFYLFDVGVANFLLERRLRSSDHESFGSALEHFIYLELKAYLSYNRRREPLRFWRTLSQIEVDFVVGKELAVEVKASRNISYRDTKPLLYLAEELPEIRKVVVCQEATYRRTEELVEIFPVEQFLQELWEGKII